MDYLSDYIKFVANSMGVELSDDKLNNIANKLIKSEKYLESLYELEEMIFEERQNRRRVIWPKK